MFKDLLGMVMIGLWHANFKIDLLTPKGKSLCNIARHLTHANPTCKRVKLMVKNCFPVIIYKIFKAFMEAMKYTLFEVIITRL